MRVKKYDIRRGDERNIVLSKVDIHKDTGEEVFSEHRYYGTWEAALLRAADLGITSDDSKRILKEISNTKEEIIKELRVLQESYEI
jgi:hypothetical protein